MAEKDILGKLLIDKEKLSSRIKDMAVSFEEKIADKDIDLIILYRGGKEFAEEFISYLSRRYPISILSAKSYLGTESTGKIEISWIEKNISGGSIFVLDDVADTGLTINAVKVFLEKDCGKEADFIVMLRKERFSGNIFDYGFSIGNDFVVGRGLDLDGKYRDLDEIRVISS